MGQENSKKHYYVYVQIKGRGRGQDILIQDVVWIAADDRTDLYNILKDSFGNNLVDWRIIGIETRGE